MAEPDEAVTEATLRELARAAGVSIPEEELDDQLEQLRDRVAATRSWRERGLGFRFADGTFEYVPPAHGHRHRWDVPTPMNARHEPAADDADADDDG